MINLSFKTLLSGISSLSHAGGGKNSSLLQKKSVFTIAYDDMASSNIQPPSSAGISNQDEEKYWLSFS